MPKYMIINNHAFKFMLNFLWLLFIINLANMPSFSIFLACITYASHSFIYSMLPVIVQIKYLSLFFKAVV